ncbi:MAG: hypothetical protein QM606_03195 [Leucobacter sp.]
MNTFLSRIEEDLRTAQISGPMGIYSKAAESWIEGSGHGDPDDFEGQYVLSLPGRLHALHGADDGGPSPTEIMNEVQDWVTDEIGRGWPELLDETGQFLAILTPSIDSAFGAAWVGAGVSIPVGSLTQWKDRIRA